MKLQAECDNLFGHKPEESLSDPYRNFERPKNRRKMVQKTGEMKQLYANTQRKIFTFAAALRTAGWEVKPK